MERLRDHAAGNSAADTAAFLLTLPAPPQGHAALLLEALFGATTGMLAPVVAKKAPLLAKAVGAPGSKDGQRALLAGLEHLLGVVVPGAAKQAAVVIKALYDADVLEEPVIDAWYSAAGDSVGGVPAAASAEVRKQAFPFVNWLRTADSDEDDDE